jgi:hypothetical protein
MPPVEHKVEELRLPGEAPGYETSADLFVSGGVELILNPFDVPVSGLWVAISAADQPNTAGAGHSRRERATSHASHGGKDDRMIDAKEFGDAGAHWERLWQFCCNAQPTEDNQRIRGDLLISY